MTIYRIQDKDGRGPFKPGFSAKWLDEEPKKHEAALKPWPEEFPETFFAITILRMIYCGCGCESPKQLRMWFSKSEMNRLTGFGYRPVKMEVDEILAKSKVQLVFRRLAPLRDNVREFKLY